MFPEHKRGRFISRKGIDSKSRPSFLCNCFLYNHSKWNIILKILDKCDSKVKKKTQFKVKNNKPKQCVFNPFSAKKLKFTLGCWSTVCLLDTKRWEKLVLLFFSLKYPSSKEITARQSSFATCLFSHTHTHTLLKVIHSQSTLILDNHAHTTPQTGLYDQRHFFPIKK